MPEPDSVAGDLLTAGTFLAGLILAYLGSLSTGYGSFTAEQQSDVRGSYRLRAWCAFGGFTVAIASVALAIGSTWFDSPAMLCGSVILLLAVFAGGIVSALMMVLEIG